MSHVCVNAHLSLNMDVNTDQLSARPSRLQMLNLWTRWFTDNIKTSFWVNFAASHVWRFSTSAAARFTFTADFFTSSLHWLLTIISQQPAASLKFSPSSGAAEWDVTAAVLTCRSEVGLTVGVTLQSPRAPRYLCDRAEASTHLTESDFTTLTNTSSSFWLQNQFFLNLNDLKWFDVFVQTFKPE